MYAGIGRGRTIPASQSPASTKIQRKEFILSLTQAENTLGLNGFGLFQERKKSLKSNFGKVRKCFFLRF
jgi:hypothetical protein